jgi:carbon starvation protein
MKVFDSNPKVGFLAVANHFSAALEQGVILAPAKSIEEMNRLIFNNRLDAGLTLLFMFVVVSVVGFGVRTAIQSLRSDVPTAKESVYEAV